MREERPNPEELLLQIQKEEEKKIKKGKCSIFLGYAAGVGKTYAMLMEAHELVKANRDVVAAYIEPHARPETIAMAEGLETIEPLQIEYKGIRLREMDLDAVLKRKPGIALVDELAHTNAEGSRHEKRYEDIEELLDAGIDVYTTVNIQHLESLNDLVSGITGIRVKERVPDTFFDRAEEVKIIDVEPEVLMKRLKEGKIYKAVQAERALENFFAREKLISLREIALRRTADRVNRIAIEERQLNSDKNYYTGEHILTCISPSPSCMKVIRSASRMASAFHAEFTAIYVETPYLQNADRKIKKMAEDNIHLAKALGAKIVTVFGEEVALQIAEYARVCRASKIVLGRTNHRILFGQKKGTLTDQVSELLPDVDIYIIPDTGVGKFGSTSFRERIVKRRAEQQSMGVIFRDFLKTGIIFGVVTLAGLWMKRFDPLSVNIIILYLFGILLLSLSCRNRWIPAAAALFSVLLFNFFFIPPLYSMGVWAPVHYTTFGFMFLFSLIISAIITRQRKQAKESAKQVYRTELLLENSKRMQSVHTVKELLKELSGQVLKLMNLSVLFFVKEEKSVTGPWLYPREGVTTQELRTLYDSREKAVVQWVLENRKRAGCCTHTLPGAKAMYLPIQNGETLYAVMGILLEERREIPSFEYALLSAMLNEAALVLERIFS